MSGRVVELREPRWGFREGAYYKTGRYTTTVDPTPCYPHDAGLVGRTLALVEGRVDVLCKPTYYLLHREPGERTNGWAQTYDIYPKPEDAAAPPWDGYVVLAGKRIPPHPAMTRYLTAHEYGHHAEYEALRRRGLAVHRQDVEREYGRLRGLRTRPGHYGPGTWHATWAEVFANDFRVLVCGVEEEFWPHEARHPAELGARTRGRLLAWWRENLSVE